MNRLALKLLVAALIFAFLAPPFFFIGWMLTGPPLSTAWDMGVRITLILTPVFVAIGTTLRLPTCNFGKTAISVGAVALGWLFVDTAVVSAMGRCGILDIFLVVVEDALILHSLPVGVGGVPVLWFGYRLRETYWTPMRLLGSVIVVPIQLQLIYLHGFIGFWDTVIDQSSQVELRLSDAECSNTKSLSLKYSGNGYGDWVRVRFAFNGDLSTSVETEVPGIGEEAPSLRLHTRNWVSARESARLVDFIEENGFFRLPEEVLSGNTLLCEAPVWTFEMTSKRGTKRLVCLASSRMGDSDVLARSRKCYRLGIQMLELADIRLPKVEFR